MVKKVKLTGNARLCRELLDCGCRQKIQTEAAKPIVCAMRPARREINVALTFESF